VVGLLLGSALACLALQPTPVRGQADPLPLDLRVHRGATCLDIDALRDELAVHLEDVALPGGVTVEVEGSDDDPHTVTTRVRYADGSLAERVFSPAPTFCPYLHQAVAITLALALKAADGRPLPTAPEAPVEAPATTEPASSGPALALAPRPLEPADEQAHSFAFGLGPELAVAVIGRAAFGASLAAALAYRHVVVRIEPSYLRVPSTDLAGFGTYHVGWLAMRTGICGVLPLGDPALRAELCVAAEVGRAVVHHAGEDRSGETNRTLVGWSPGGALVWDAGEIFTFRVAANLHHVYRPLQIAVADQNGNRLAEEDLGRVGGLFSMSLAFRVPFGSKRH
jgi:hypothetical protein